MKINYALISRSLIALLFVVAGVNKIMGFEGTVGYVGSLGVPLPMIATILIIIIEIPIALMFAWGYKVKQTGYALIAFTALATLLAHPNVFGTDMVTVLKNIAIIGGIMASIACVCGDCTTHRKKD